MAPQTDQKNATPTGTASRGLWLAIVVLSGAVVGLVAGLLSWLGGLNPPSAVLTGGAAFGGTVLLALAVLRFSINAPD